MRPLALAAAGVFALAAVACGDDDDGGDDDTADPGVTVVETDGGDTEPEEPAETPPTTEPDDEAAAPDTTDVVEAAEEPGADPVPGGELVVGTIFDAFGLEPTRFVGAVTDAHIAFALYDPLMMLSPDGEPEPYLAESLETDDWQHYTITLHEGVTFHDGTPLDAEAVKINLERHMDPATESRVLGNATHIDTVTVVDEHTVEIVVNFPWPAFPEVLASNLGLIASPAAIDAGNLNEEPVGSGPFVFSDRVPGDHTTLDRNDDYWQDGKPSVDRVVFRVMLDEEVRQTSVAAGEIDAAQSIRADNLAAADDEEGVYATLTPGHVNTIHINSESEPMNDLRVRQALAHAIDYDAINQVMFGGAAEPVHHYISSDSPFFDPTAPWAEYDPELAAQLVAEYEAEHGPVEFTFRCYTEPSRVRLTEMLEQMWTAVGMDVTTDLSDQTSLVVDLSQRNFTAGCFSMGVETADPDLMWYTTLHSESPLNYLNYANEDMDRALETGRTEPDEAARAEAYATVQQLLATEVPVIQYASSAWGWVVSDSVEGFVALPGGEFLPGEAFFTE